MFNGLWNKINQGVAGFIMACLITATIGPLFIPTTKKPTLAEVAEGNAPSRSVKALSLKNTPRQDESVTEDWKPARAENAQAVAVTNRQSTEEPRNTNVVNGTPIDLYLLARVIHAEGRGEPFEGQVAIGAVLINRLRDPRFPKSLPQIIFKRGEFCTVRDGQIWLQPNDEAIRAAKLAAAGWDPTNGALYFYNPAKTTSKWIWNRPVTNHIGRHIFAA